MRAISRLGRKVTIMAADLDSSEGVASLTRTLINDRDRLDILVNCAGVQRRHPSEQFPDADWDEVCPKFLPLLPEKPSLFFVMISKIKAREMSIGQDTYH